MMTKKEQLKNVFKTILISMIKEIDYTLNPATEDRLVEKNTNILLKEVSIRTPLK